MARGYLQMLEDAASQSKKTNDQYNKHIARHWLEAQHKDVYMVCDLAGFDPDYIRKNVKRALLNNCKWRKEVLNAKDTSPKAPLTTGVPAPAALNSWDYETKSLELEAG